MNGIEIFAGTSQAGENSRFAQRQPARTRVAAAALWLCAALTIGLLVPGIHRRGVMQDAPVPPEPSPPIVYSLWLRNDMAPPRVIVSLRAEVPVGENSVTVQMPAWSPGDYHIQNHGRFVQDLHAEGISGSRQTGALRVRQSDPNTWQIDAAGSRSVLVTYGVPQTPAGIFSDNVTLAPHYVFVNGPSAFAYVVGHKTSHTNLYVYLPPDWRAEAALPPLQNADPTAAAAFTAPDYDTLADSPLVMADPQGMVVRQFEVDHVPHRAVFFHTPLSAEDVNSFVPLLKQVVQAENDIMGGPPYARYDFLFDVGGAGGGLEHMNSARMLLWPGASPKGFESFIAHEFFHLWNVKRIRQSVVC